MNPPAVQNRYRELLEAKLGHAREVTSDEITALGRELASTGFDPEEIVAQHEDILTRATGDTPLAMRGDRVERARQLLLGVMIAQGLAMRERLAHITEEREQAAAVAEQERADLLATVAHEMRTPLTAALGAIELIERDLARERTDRIVPWLATAREALQRLSRQTMDLAHASAGEQPGLNFAPRDLCAIVSEAVTWAEALAAKRRVALTFDLAARAVPVDADADALLSIFGNLLSNAISYTPAGGSIAVACGADRAEVWVTIADSGIGMTPEVQARIFEKFYRAPEARQAEAQGLGLGLSLVHDLVQQHGGSVAVWSALGTGSTFRVVLPRGHSLPLTPPLLPEMDWDSAHV